MAENTALQATQRGEIVQAQGVTYDLYTRFVSYIDAAPATVTTYTKAVRQFMEYLAENGITHPQREDVIAFRDGLKASGRKATTIQAYITAVRLFFQWTEQEGLYANIADRVKGAKITKGHKKDYLTSGQTAAILYSIDRGSLQGLRDYAIFSLCVTGGLRTIEVTRANIEDMGTAGNSAALYIQGKGQAEKSDFVKLARPVERAILDYLQARGERDPKAPLFASTSNNSTGGRLSTRSVSGIIKRCMQQAGYDSERLTAHSLRHTAATLNLLAGGTLQETQQLLRHSSINTTTIYAHNLERAANKSEERIAGAIFKPAAHRKDGRL